MKKIFTNYRYYVLLVLGLIALIGIMAVPAENLPKFYWLYVLVSTKLIGFTAVYVFARLVKRWEQRETIPELINALKNY